MNIHELIHPDYVSSLSNWIRWRTVYEAGDDFIEDYLKQYSQREDVGVFNKRKEITYAPAFASAAINDVGNAIFQRASDIKRVSDSNSYMQAITGLLGGVDYKNATINSFINTQVLKELLVMAKVGVYVDMEKEIGETQADLNGRHPYLYMYKAEDIRNWLYDKQNNLIKLILRNHTYELDPITGLPVKPISTFLYFEKREIDIVVTEYDAEGKEISGSILVLPQIPFVMPEISQSLMTNIDKYQIALLNLASSDLHYAITSNFPFYTEQFDPRAESGHFMRQADSGKESGPNDGGTAPEATVAKDKTVVIGMTQGRRYPPNMERPGFIHPSPEPLTISMEKQEKMKKEIRELINLSLATITSKMVSAESREIENEGLESGLAAIGSTLEATERQIARYWNNYESIKSDAVITYPKIYSLKSDSQRLKEADEKTKLLVKMPSLTYRKEMAKDIAQLTLGHRISPDELEKIFSEIDAAKSIIDIETTIRAKELSIISGEFADESLGIPPTEAKKGEDDNARRVERLAVAQALSKGSEDTNGSSNGSSNANNDDPNANPTDDTQGRIDRKAEAQNPATSQNGKKLVRGKGRRF